MLTLAFYLHCFLSVCAAVCFADLLIQPGMLLAPVQAWLRDRYRFLANAYVEPYEPGGYEPAKELDDRIWWKPLWGCPTCVAAWWALIAYLYHYHGAAYCWYEHIYFVALGLLFSLLIQWIIRKLQS